MKRIIRTYFNCVPILFLLVGCTYYDNNQNYDHRNYHVTNDTNTRDRTDYFQQTGNEEQNANVENQVNQMNNTENHVQTFVVATQAEKAVQNLEDVFRSTIIVNNNIAYVAVVTRGNASTKLTPETNESISAHIRAVYPQIEQVNISSNPHFVQEMNEFRQRINQGETDFRDEFQQVIREVF